MGLWNVNLGTCPKLNSYGKSLLSGSGSAKEALAKFAMLVEAESALVGAETLTELKGGFARVNSDMKISRQLEETRMQTEMTRQERINANLRRLLQPSTSPEHRYSTMNRNRVPQIGDWIREETEFIDWVGEKKPVLSMSGNPEARKSYIATKMIHHQNESRRSLWDSSFSRTTIPQPNPTLSLGHGAM